MDRTHTSGFVAVPRRLYDALLTADLNARELRILLLIVRLTYGCRNAPRAMLRPADLVVVGIGSNHARACLDALVSDGFATHHRSSYRIATEQLVSNSERNPERQGRLSTLVGEHLSGKAQHEEVGPPNTGTPSLPIREGTPSQNGKDNGCAFRSI